MELLAALHKEDITPVAMSNAVPPAMVPALNFIFVGDAIRVCERVQVTHVGTVDARGQ